MMDQFRELFELVHVKEARPFYWYRLAPWVDTHAEAIQWLKEFASRSGEPIPGATDGELWTLYALSRVNDTLLRSFQTGSADGNWPGQELSVDDYMRFVESLGMTVVDKSAFSPFFHEIVHVEEVEDADCPITLVSTLWPCAMLGSMLFSRGGVEVMGGRNHIKKDVAEKSTLYWAYRRKNRPYRDLSQGWGSNSQWGTTFRRDYRIAGHLYYNVDARLPRDYDVVLLQDGLTKEERIELLTNRCLIKTEKRHDDLWPYDDTYQDPE